MALGFFLAGGAQPAGFKGDVADLETALGRTDLDVVDIGDGDFDALTAAFAQQEAGGVLVIAGVAGDEGVQAFDTMDQAHLFQEAEGAIDGRWLRRAIGMEAVDHVIGLYRRAGLEDQFIGAQARRRHAFAGFDAQGLGFRQAIRLGVGFQVVGVVVCVFANMAHTSKLRCLGRFRNPAAVTSPR